YPVMIDRVQLEQAIINLTVNARDAMPNGGSIGISAENVHFDEPVTLSHGSVQPGNYVLISLKDTGIGMDSETQSHIFEPFFTTKGVGKGTGLGLSTVYGVVEQSRGAISVESTSNLGSTFKIFLPESKEQKPSQVTHVPSRASVTGEEAILLVEDQSAIREIASDYLMKLGYNV